MKYCHSNLMYKLLFGLGVVLFLRGVWMIFDGFPIFSQRDWSGWLTLVVSLIIILSIDKNKLIDDNLSVIKKEITEIKNILKNEK